MANTDLLLLMDQVYFDRISWLDNLCVPSTEKVEVPSMKLILFTLSADN